MVLVLNNEYFEELEKAERGGAAQQGSSSASAPAWWEQLEQMSDEHVCRLLVEHRAMPTISRGEAADGQAERTASSPRHVGQTTRDPGRLLELAKWMKAHGRSMPPTSVDPKLMFALTNLVDVATRNGSIELEALEKGLKSAGFDTIAKAIRARVGDASALKREDVVQWMLEEMLADRTEWQGDHKWRIHSLGSAMQFASAVAARCEVEGAVEASARRVLEVTSSLKRPTSMTSVFSRLSVGRSLTSSMMESSKQARGTRTGLSNSRLLHLPLVPHLRSRVEMWA